MHGQPDDFTPLLYLCIEIAKTKTKFLEIYQHVIFNTLWTAKSRETSMSLSTGVISTWTLEYKGISITFLGVLFLSDFWLGAQMQNECMRESAQAQKWKKSVGT